MTRSGRPVHVPTDDTRNLVESLSGFGIPQDEISRLVGIAVRPKNSNGRETSELGGVG